MFNSFAGLNAATWEMPARPISMPDEKHARDLVNDDSLNPESHDISEAGEGGSQSSQQNIGPLRRRTRRRASLRLAYAAALSHGDVRAASNAALSDIVVHGFQP